MSDIAELQKRALGVRKKYDTLNEQPGQIVWSGADFAAGLSSDAGALIEAIMVKDNKRNGDGSDARLGHKLSDCLWSVLVIADRYNIDLESAFNDTMNQLDERLAA